MLIRRFQQGNFRPQPKASSAWRLVIATICCWGGLIPSLAQGPIPQAVVTNVTGSVMFHRSSGGRLSPLTLRRGLALQPRDVIDTGNGSVVIAMHDGSQVIIYPRSRVTLKDFRAAASWLDLLEVAVGRIRAKINHYGKRPNPYRVYSPIASIAVRGTDFLVGVKSNAETQVQVFEGLVEVSSLANPQQTVLVKPGRNIVVRPDGDISMVTAGPRGELNEITNLHNYYVPSANLYGAYSDHYSGILMPHKQLRSSRFAAFSDSHLDSLQNPAYATEFTQANGRLYLVPSLSPPVELNSGYAEGYTDSRGISSTVVNSSNYTLSPQSSYFVPLGSKMVVGGGMAVAQTRLRGAGSLLTIDGYGTETETPIFDSINTSVKFTTVNLSLVVARRIGQTERTSVGVKFDYLGDHSSFVYQSELPAVRYFDRTLDQREAHSRRTGLSIGLTHDFEGGKKLGIYYRYSSGSTLETLRWTSLRSYKNCDCYRLLDYNLDDYKPTAHLSEAGALFRSSLTTRLFYGVEGSMLFGRGRASWGPQQDKIRTKRATLGAGIGYALRPRTVFSLDLSAALTSENLESKSAVSMPGILYYRSEQGYSQFLHGGAQTDLRRNIFVGGSILLVRDRKLGGTRYSDLDRDYSTYFSTRKYPLSNFSIGWRLKPDWIVQYVYSTSYGRGVPSHSLMFRYELGRKSRERE